jgi:hypothetical protein
VKSGEHIERQQQRAAGDGQPGAGGAIEVIAGRRSEQLVAVIYSGSATPPGQDIIVLTRGVR